MSNSNAPGRTRLIGVVLLVATFLAGGFSGAAVERRASAAPAAARPEAKVDLAKQEEERPHGRRARIFDQLDLSPEQRAAIDSILQDGREKVDAYWKETEPGYRALLDTTRAHVRAVMTSEQLVEYDRLRAEHRARARHESGAGADGCHETSGKGNSCNETGRKGISSNDSRAGGGNGKSSGRPHWPSEPKETRTE